MNRISRFGIYQSQLKDLKQTDRQLGCIPTNIAAALQAYGVKDASENGIQTAYRYAISFETGASQRYNVPRGTIVDSMPPRGHPVNQNN
jgi:hypothetical protein